MGPTYPTPGSRSLLLELAPRSSRAVARARGRTPGIASTRCDGCRLARCRCQRRQGKAPPEPTAQSRRLWGVCLRRKRDRAASRIELPGGCETHPPRRNGTAGRPLLSARLATLGARWRLPNNGTAPLLELARIPVLAEMRGDVGTARTVKPAEPQRTIHVLPPSSPITLAKSRSGPVQTQLRHK